ncbi:hypothetical protein REJC140_00677 [Pseudorhizobium endolithicum]|uniref:DUF4112 domain-containing protein n=1 Tax=Pseudorhizobium endolithicum TaxID=1191678 RepID=A0ABN7JPL9_9HYPH|nr:DUF4112 domain-containing protein [Pseudorhizobium endolithicum]CAD7038861.1 hypothetical protein REJC140_00677 [Pseudorhizobium endolithicum]
MVENEASWKAGTDFGRERAHLFRRLRRLNNLARFLDTALRVPGTSTRLGADSLIGLLPIVGDASGAIVGLAIVNEGRRLGLPSEKLARMLTNIAVDAVVGAVPLLGDAFDIYFKAHRRNIGIILEHFGVDATDLESPGRERRQGPSFDASPRSRRGGA